MKRYILLIIFLLSIAKSTFACDYCGCGAVNYYIGVMPQITRHFAGVRYRQAGFTTESGHIGHNATTERFHVAELWGRFYPHRKIQVMGFLPYGINIQTDGERRVHENGLADAVLLANYNVFRYSSSSEDRTVRHSAWIGGGVKLPTGNSSFSRETQGEDLGANANFQLGTGSWDFLLTGLYNLRFEKLGFSLDCSYRINGENNAGYHFGNRISGTLAAFYVQKLSSNFAIMPTLGLYAENSGYDRDNGDWNKETGGHLLAGQIGIDLYLAQNYALHFAYQHPLDQEISKGYTVAKGRGIVGVIAMF